MQQEDIFQNRQLLYQDDPSKLEFEATIQEKINLPNGRTGIILDHTYFYPTGGGQEHDTGYLEMARVIDVYKDDNIPFRVVHIIDRDLALGPVQAKIDPDRRLRHMQHHTAQHLLTYCFIHLLAAETVSANINGYTPSTLDLATKEIAKVDLERVEDLANALIYENRSVKAYFVSPDKIHKLPLRKPPSVKENIRIIEIDTLDFSACGGTHVDQTGSIGLIKIVRTERVNDKLRIHFIAGWQAFELFRSYFDTFTRLAAQLTTAPLDLPQVVQRMNDQLGSNQKELQSLRLQQTKWEASTLLQQSQLISNRHFIHARFSNRSMQELRILAEELRQHDDTVSLLISTDGKKASILVACANNSGLSARETLHKLLEPISGRGGGDNSLAQGGGLATEEQISQLISLANTLIAEQS